MSLVEVPLGSNGSVDLGGVGVPLPGETASACSARGLGRLLVGLRPEALRLSGDGIPARVEAVEVLGADAYVFCSAEVGGARHASRPARTPATRPRAVTPCDSRRRAATRTSSTRRAVSASRPDRAGAWYRAELAEQPVALLRLLDGAAAAADAGRAIRRRRPRFVRLVGHGSSDNAAAFGTYAFGLLGGNPAFRDSISLSVYYGAEHELGRTPVVALSQSGRTPDVVEYVDRARARGALTIAVTNDPLSELADAAEITVPLHAGPERAVAATKTYVNQLAALALLAASAGDRASAIS